MFKEFNSEKRQRQIDEYLAADYKVGDMVQVRGKDLRSNTSQDSNAWNDLEVVGIQPDGKLELRRSGYRPNDYHGELNIIDPKEVEVRKDSSKIGVNPFPEKDWMSCVRTTGYGFSHIYFTMEEIIKNNNVANTINGIDVFEYNFNPYVIDNDGKKLYYQRDYVWTLEDEQAFIESIYNNLSLGTVVLRKRSYNYVKSQAEKGNKEVGYFDVVDGKQRLHTLKRFLNNEFADMHGNYFGDFSTYARRMFYQNPSGLNVLEIEERATDEDVLRVFMNVNYSGKPMSKEHLEYVRSLFEKF